LFSLSHSNKNQLKGILGFIFGDKRRCYLAGYQEPCPTDEVMFAQKQTSFGLCSCKCLFDSVEQPSINFATARYLFCGVKIECAFDKRTGTCYKLQQRLCTHFIYLSKTIPIIMRIANKSLHVTGILWTKAVACS